MAGLVPAIHALQRHGSKTWMPATSAGMTAQVKRRYRAQTPDTIFQTANSPTTVIASQRVGAKRRPMTGSAKQSIGVARKAKSWIASSLRSSQ